MAMLRKALVASFIATPTNSKNGAVEMKSTENRRLSVENIAKKEEAMLEKKVECLVLNEEEEQGESSNSEEQEVLIFRCLELTN